MFQSLFERCADAMLLFDPQAGVFVDCNQAAVKLMGAGTKDELLLGRPEDFSPLLQPDGSLSRERTAQIVSLVEEHGSHRFEWVGRRFDGREVPMEVLVTAVQLGGRKLNVSVARDITERKRTEAALRESEQKFRGLFEASSDGIIIIDPKSRMNLDCNAAALRMAGGNREWLLARVIEDLAPERQPDGRSSSEAVKAWIERALTHGPQRFEWMARRYDGKSLPVEVLLTPLHLGDRLLLVAASRDISERKRTEQELLELNQSLEHRVAERTAALAASEAQFRALVENAPEAIVVFDGDSGRFLFGNEHASKLYGVPMEKLAELTPADVSPEFQADGRRSSELAREKMDEALAGGTPIFEWNHRQPDGKLIPTEVRLLRLPAEGRNLIRASIIDNTERKRAQAALAESQALFSAAFEASPILIVIARMSDERYVLVNDAFVNWSGCTQEELLEKNSTEFGIWESEDERAAVWADLRREGSIHERECHFRNRKGNRTTMLISFEVIQINHASHVLAMGLDITERKQAEAESRANEARLRESETRFSAAFNASPALIGILRMSDTRYVLVNEAHLNWLGYPREEVLGRTCLELGMWEHPADRDLLLKDIQTFGSVRQRECRWRNRHGERFTFLLSAETIKLNNTPHVISMALDITQRKQAEIETLKALAREKELSQLKSNFVSMVSHEFRTPLAIIQSSAELLREFFPKMQPVERDEQLESITGNTSRMARMMEEILVLSRLDAGKLDFRPSAMDLDGFCRGVVDEVLSATYKRCPIELLLPSVLPPAHADERLLQHILTNLLSNAVKYSEPGAGIRFTVERKSAHVLCIIRDEGIGIPKNDQQLLFSAFYRGGNVGSRPGTGLGLLLVKRCVELHHGKVWIESKVDQGTTVTVRLPVFQTDL